MLKGRLLLINPWIYDFAAFNLWVEPIGLLSIASILREHGYELDFIDCLDRYNPELLKLQGLSEPKGMPTGPENITGNRLKSQRSSNISLATFAGTVSRPISLRRNWTDARSRCRLGDIKNDLLVPGPA